MLSKCGKFFQRTLATTSNGGLNQTKRDRWIKTKKAQVLAFTSGLRASPVVTPHPHGWRRGLQSTPASSRYKGEPMKNSDRVGGSDLNTKGLKFPFNIQFVASATANQPNSKCLLLSPELVDGGECSTWYKCVRILFECGTTIHTNNQRRFSHQNTMRKQLCFWFYPTRTKQCESLTRFSLWAIGVEFIFYWSYFRGVVYVSQSAHPDLWPMQFVYRLYCPKVYWQTDTFIINMTLNVYTWLLLNILTVFRFIGTESWF